MFQEILMSADGFLSALVEYDKDLLLSLNGSDSLYLDRVMRVLTATVTWVPLYISLFYVVLNNNDNFRKVMMILCGAGLCVLLAGTVDDMIVKPMVGPRDWLAG